MSGQSTSQQFKESSVSVEEIKSNNEPKQSHRPSHPVFWARHWLIRTHNWASRYFPWRGEASPGHIDGLHKRKSFPWLGLSCILISLLTVAISFAIFKSIDGRVEFASKYVKPASWLSIIVSINSIVLHIALNEGVTTAWWYRASRADATMEDLHETYKMGTSTVAVLLAGKKFNYVAMATIFVATIPLNGFLLQDALSLEPNSKINDTTLYLPLVQQLPLGFSAQATNGSPTAWSSDFIAAVNSLEGLTKLPVGMFYPAGRGLGGYGSASNLAWYGCVNQGYKAMCTGNTTMTGFNMTCTTAFNETYDLRPSQYPNGVTARVFSSNVTWDPAKPDIIDVEMLYKPNQTCQGNYERKTCRLQAAKMRIPVQIKSDEGFVQYGPGDLPSAVISLPDYVDPSEFIYQGELTPYSDEGVENSTYGGIAQWLIDRYSGSIDWTYADGSWHTTSNGTIARAYELLDYTAPQNSTTGEPQFFSESDGTWLVQPFAPRPNNASWCNNTYDGLDWMTDAGSGNSYSFDPMQTMLIAANQLAVLGSASLALTQWTNNETMQSAWTNATNGDRFMEDWVKQQYPPSSAKQYQNVFLYHTRYGYWAASVAVTVSIVLMILPLFYGFWVLERRATLSPFETAAAFRAPGLEGVDMKKDADDLLKEIGKRQVHAHNSGSEISLPSYPRPTWTSRTQSTEVIRSQSTEVLR